MAEINDQSIKSMQSQAKKRSVAFSKEMRRIERRRAKEIRDELKRRSKEEKTAQKRAERLAKDRLKQAKLLLKKAPDAERKAIEVLVEQRRTERSEIEQIGAEMRKLRKEEMSVASKRIAMLSSRNFQNKIPASANIDVIETEGQLTDLSNTDDSEKSISSNSDELISQGGIGIDDTASQATAPAANVDQASGDAEIVRSRREADRAKKIAERERKRAEEAEAKSERERLRAEEAGKKLAEKENRDRQKAAARIERRKQRQERGGIFGSRSKNTTGDGRTDLERRAEIARQRSIERAAKAEARKVALEAKELERARRDDAKRAAEAEREERRLRESEQRNAEKIARAMERNAAREARDSGEGSQNKRPTRGLSRIFRESLSLNGKGAERNQERSIRKKERVEEKRAAALAKIELNKQKLEIKRNEDEAKRELKEAAKRAALEVKAEAKLKAEEAKTASEQRRKEEKAIAQRHKEEAERSAAAAKLAAERAKEEQRAGKIERKEAELIRRNLKRENKKIEREKKKLQIIENEGENDLSKAQEKSRSFSFLSLLRNKSDDKLDKGKTRLSRAERKAQEEAIENINRRAEEAMEQKRLAESAQRNAELVAQEALKSAKREKERADSAESRIESIVGTQEKIVAQDKEESKSELISESETNEKIDALTSKDNLQEILTSLNPLSTLELDKLTEIYEPEVALQLQNWVKSLTPAMQRRLLPNDLALVAQLWRSEETGADSAEIESSLQVLIAEVEIRPLAGPAVSYADANIEVFGEDNGPEIDSSPTGKGWFRIRKRATKGVFKERMQEARNKAKKERLAEKARRRSEKDQLKASKRAKLTDEKISSLEAKDQVRAAKLAAKQAIKEKRDLIKEADRLAKSEGLSAGQRREIRKAEMSALREVEKSAKESIAAAEAAERQRATLSIGSEEPRSRRYKIPFKMKRQKAVDDKETNIAIPGMAPSLHGTSSTSDVDDSNLTDVGGTSRRDLRRSEKERKSRERSERERLKGDQKAAVRMQQSDTSEDDLTEEERVKLERTMLAGSASTVRIQRKELKRLQKIEEQQAKMDRKARLAREKTDRGAQQRAEREARREQERLEQQRRVEEARAKVLAREAERISKQAAKLGSIATPVDGLQNMATAQYTWSVESGSLSAFSAGNDIDANSYDLPEGLPRRS